MADLYKQPYNRMMGVNSQYSQQQTRHCSTGYRWDAVQQKCVPLQNLQKIINVRKETPSVGQPQPGQFQGVTQPQPGQFQNMTKPGTSDYAKMLAQAIDMPSPTMQPGQFQGSATGQQWGGQQGTFGAAASGEIPSNCVKTTQIACNLYAKQDPSWSWNGQYCCKSDTGGGTDLTCEEKCYQIPPAQIARRTACLRACRNNDGTEDTCAQLSAQGCVPSGGANCARIYPGKPVSTTCTGVGGVAQIYCCPGGGGETERDAEAYCRARGGVWIVSPGLGRGVCMPGGQMPGYKRLPGGDIWDWAQNKFGFNPLDPNALQVGERPGIDYASYLDPTNYTSGLAALTQGVFGGKTLDELERERINAARQDIGLTYEDTRRQMMDRLKNQAELKGMFQSGTNQEIMGRELRRLGEREAADINKQIATIRGERPELLLQQQEAQRKAFETWGNLDIAAKDKVMSALLGDKRAEYDRMFNNGQLTLDAFNGNLGMMRLYLDNILSSVRTEAEYNQTIAKIYAILQQMDDNQRNWILSML